MRKFFLGKFTLIGITLSYLGLSIAMHKLYDILLHNFDFPYIDNYNDSVFYTIPNLCILIIGSLTLILNIFIENPSFVFIDSFFTNINYVFGNIESTIITNQYLTYLSYLSNWLFVYIMFIVLIIINFVATMTKKMVKFAVVAGVLLVIYNIVNLFYVDYQYEQQEYVSKDSFSAYNVQVVEVVRIIDGDTIVIDLDGKEEKLRLLYIDTPENTTKVEKYGDKAEKFLQKLLYEATTISIEYDGNKRDKYNRLLAWLWADDILVQEALTKQGLVEDFYDYGTYKYENILVNAMKYAQRKQLNIFE